MIGRDYRTMIYQTSRICLAVRSAGMLTKQSSNMHPLTIIIICLALCAVMATASTLYATRVRYEEQTTIYCEHNDYYIIKTTPTTIRVQCVPPTD
jgi:hypothetical protein